jgi:HEAT repeat protein
MENEKLESLLIDYIDGKLSDAEKHDVEQELMRNSEAFKKYEQLKEVIQLMAKSSSVQPSAKLKRSFDDALKNEIASSKQAKVISMRPTFYRVAAAVTLLIVGGGVGFWISNQQRRAAELEAMRKEVEATKHMLMTMLDNDQSASQRVLGANVAYKMDKPDDEIVQALVKTMNDDPNTNVRLAALEALGKFNQEESVRKVLIASLSTQKDPLVQINLIRMLVEMKEKSAVKELQRITTDEEMLPEVKDEAHAGILRLS